MPRLFVSAEHLVRPSLTLTGESQRYLTRVLRLPVGARVDLFDGQGLEIAATIVRTGSKGVELELGEKRHIPRPPTPPVTLLQGLPRAERMDMVVQKATELGAVRVVPVRAVRSAAGQQGRPERWERIAREAARQCGRAEVLDVSPVLSLGDALASLPSGATRFVPWEEAPDAPTLSRLLPQHPLGVAVLIGPEGGLTAEEVAMATGSGFQVVTLGPRILRTETAAIATLAVIQSIVGGFG